MNTEKNKQISETLKKTRKKRESQSVYTVELKINFNKLNRQNQKNLHLFFVECKWLYNYLLSLSREDLFAFDTKTRDIFSLDKDKNKVDRTLTMPAKLIQAVYSKLKDNIKGLSHSKTRENKIGKFKFKSEYNSIDLNQYGVTHRILFREDGNKDGKYKNTVHINGIKGKVKVFGMEQIPYNADFANAKLVKKPSGYYLILTYYLPKEGGIKDSDKAIGIDFGIKTSITTSDGRKFDISIRESERLKGLQRKLARQDKHSNSWYKTLSLMRREYESIANRRKDKANKVIHELKKDSPSIYIQDENIKGWQKGFFGKQVQNSALGTIKSKLISQEHAYVISRFFPSTKVCPNCGTKVNLTLSERTFECVSCSYKEDRDIKAAYTILLAGQYFESKDLSCTHTEHMGTQVELKSDFQSFIEDWEHSMLRLEATTL